MKLTIPQRFQGLEGIGQGGYLGGLLSELEASSLVVSYRSPIPLDIPLEIHRNDGHLRVTAEDRLIVEAAHGRAMADPPAPVDLDAAELARNRAEAIDPPIITTCFSCGTQPEGFRIHAGPVDSGSFATPFAPPAWTAPSGTVQSRFIWAPLDCAAGWRVSLADDGKPAVTGSLVVEQLRDIEPEQTYVIVADTAGPWEGRKRRATSALYTADGELAARADSLWIAVA